MSLVAVLLALLLSLLALPLGSVTVALAGITMALVGLVVERLEVRARDDREARPGAPPPTRRP